MAAIAQSLLAERIMLSCMCWKIAWCCAEDHVHIAASLCCVVRFPAARLPLGLCPVQVPAPLRLPAKHKYSQSAEQVAQKLNKALPHALQAYPGSPELTEAGPWQVAVVQRNGAHAVSLPGRRIAVHQGASTCNHVHATASCVSS